MFSFFILLGNENILRFSFYWWETVSGVSLGQFIIISSIYWFPLVIPSHCHLQLLIQLCWHLSSARLCSSSYTPLNDEIRIVKIIFLWFVMPSIRLLSADHHQPETFHRRRRSWIDSVKYINDAAAVITLTHLCWIIFAFYWVQIAVINMGLMYYFSFGLGFLIRIFWWGPASQ